MARYIDADKLLEELQEELDFKTSMYTGEQNEFFDRGLKCAIGDVKRQPTADVVEVVRCKDCIHWGGVIQGFVCRKFSGIDTKICMGADHFCSYGTPKERGEEK